ncbi:hypothetical protein Dsin_014694 [Dipteronia sinensis]|uniref:RNase H type-1 domain-containing protein n=1 Tax=Dipteronia sinensis TaxID=43782 RepID=A0AAE0ANJ5_9ROSI|nr:hypothetical protein Dsin_014694 [Dipteronia sinensis]
MGHTLLCGLVGNLRCEKQLIFNGKEASIGQLIEVSNFIAAWWFKFCSRGTKTHISFLLFNMKDSCTETLNRRYQVVEAWTPPPFDTLKFNFDDSTRSKSGPAGIGGVMRDSNGRTLCLFSEYVGHLDANSIENMAILKALTLCTSNPEILKRNVVIVSDSKIAVSWFNSMFGVGSIQHINLIFDIKEFLWQHNNFKVIFNSRASNSLTDSLAKMG